MYLNEEDIMKVVEGAISAARNKLRDDMTALIQAKHQAMADSLQSVIQESNSTTDKVDALVLENETLKATVNSLKDDVTTLKKEVSDLRKSSFKTELRCNTVEQWTRKSAIRVFGIARHEREDCRKLVHDVIKDNLHLDMPPSVIEVAHRVGQGRDGKPPSIIVKFARRDERDTVLRARKALKNTGITFREDLTKDNQSLLSAVKDHTDISSAWSWNGKIFGKLESNDRIVNFTLGDDINLQIRRFSQEEPGQHQQPHRQRYGHGTWARSPVRQ